MLLHPYKTPCKPRQTATTMTKIGIVAFTLLCDTLCRQSCIKKGTTGTVINISMLELKGFRGSGRPCCSCYKQWRTTTQGTPSLRTETVVIPYKVISTLHTRHRINRMRKARLKLSRSFKASLFN